MATVETRALDKIERLSAEPRNLVALWDDATPVLADVVPHYMFPCYFTVDPATLLITSHYNPLMPELPRESLALQYYGDDVNKLCDVARSPSGLSTIHDATGGDPSRSRRWQANMTLGGDQEMIATLRTRDSSVWGPSPSTGSRESRDSTSATSASSAPPAYIWPKGRAGRCSSARPPTQTGLRRPGWSS